MSETKFTPGPWSVTDSHYPSFKEISGPSFGIKCVMWATDLTEDDYHKRSADLNLIAAAPELYDFVEEYLEAWENGMAGDSYLFHLAQAVRGKARGEA